MRTETAITWRNVFLSIGVGGLSLFLIAYLSFAVTHDLRLLNSASSDNVQWTLSQSEVEFLEFEGHLTETLQEATPDLKTLRQEFDIFYSRIKTLSQSELYAGLRALPNFSSNLATVREFLDGSLATIDADDPEFLAGLPELKARSAATRSSVRALSNSGLSYFASESDQRRNSVSKTLSQLAAAVGLLMLVLLLLAIYLAALNAQNVRRRSEIAQASERTKIVTGTALDAVIVSDAFGRILDFNTAAETIFRHNAEDVIGKDLGALIVPDHHLAAHTVGMERMRNGGEKRVVGQGRVKLEAKRGNGEIFPVELAIQSAETDDGEIFIAFLRDISHRVKAEQDLLQARDMAVAGEKAKTDFLATMSHEIRTPLNGLLGNLTLLQDTRMSAKQSQYIKNMNTSGRLLMSHISDVLDITKYDAGKLVLRPVTMNLSELLQDIVDSQSGTAMNNNSVLEWGWVGQPASWINGDRERIQHILMNMIGNAVKFTDDGRISVKAEVVGDLNDKPEVHVSVRDTGIGIAQDIQSQVFDDFVTGDTSYDRNVSGTGLGLGIARRFVEALGGEIGMDSIEGEGSHFWIRFPIEPVAAPAQTHAVSASASFASGRKILIVEDNEINRLVAREMLKKAGHSIKEAHDGKAGVRLAAKERFDLILMDISMPVMDGRAATKAIRNGAGLSAKTPIIALTANALAEEQKAFLSDGMNDVLTKPLSREALANVISTWTNTQQNALPPGSANHLDELRDTVGADALAMLLDRFSVDIDALLDWLSNVAEHELEEVQSRVHKVAGSAAAVGATDLRASLRVIETSAKSGDKAQMETACATLPSVWSTTRVWFTEQQSQ